MRIERRDFMVTTGAAVMGVVGLPAREQQKEREMYGLIGKMITVPGQRDAFIQILLGGVGNMPGCLSYVVAKDPRDETALWVTEVWDSQASHEASLTLPAVKEAIARGRPMIAGFGDRVVTTPVGGHGLAESKR